MRADGSLQLTGQRGHDLADIAITLNDLPDAEAAPQQLFPVQGGGVVDRSVGGVSHQMKWCGRRLLRERLDQLSQKQGDAEL